MLTVMFGYAQVLLLDIAKLAGDEVGFESIQAYLSDEEHLQSVTKLPWFGLPAQTSVLVPFGFVPVIAGLSPTDEDTDVLAYAITYLLDLDGPKRCEKLVCAEVAANLTKSLQKTSKTIKEVGPTVQKWMKEWADRLAL